MNGARLWPAAALAVALLLPLGLHAQAPAADCPPPPVPPTAETAAAGVHDAHDHGFLWRIRKDGRLSHLYGTLHVARRDWMFPGPRVREALDASDTLALEVDLLDPETRQRLATGMAAPAGAVLPAALQRRLERRARAECADPAALARLGPEVQLAVLTTLAARRNGLEADYGIDMFLAGFARGRGLRVAALETPEEQLGALREPEPGSAAALLDSGLAELDSGRAQALLARLAQLWADGDHATLAGYAQWCECLRTPGEIAAMHRLLDERNPALARRIDALHAAGTRVFAAVGSLHMIGPQGLPALLAQRGYQVERMVFESSALDIPAWWDFADPVRSEAVFREHLGLAGGDAALVLRTQIARSLGLRGQFERAHAELDAVDAELTRAGAEPQVRALLERGRVWRSSGRPEQARPLFEQAVDRAGAARLDDLAVDALHMVALVEPDPELQLQWNRRALAAARSAADPRARRWEASLANNIGVSLHDAGRHEEALQSLRQALAARERLGARPEIRVARSMVAWALRFLDRHDEALALLQALEREHAAAGGADAFVFEEIGENLLAQGQAARARPYFAQAHALLARADNAERPDPQRLARLLELSR